ncbi:MAG TPA: hypothetical protein DD706_03655 [Nitrospiraceae bacterium]|nr:hypothetical protein [Nitrospiraceae bacterium]
MGVPGFSPGTFFLDFPTMKFNTQFKNYKGIKLNISPKESHHEYQTKNKRHRRSDFSYWPGGREHELGHQSNRR